MLESQQSLSFSVAANPGVYALLLGSGVSRSAGIPTGWDIVLDLLSKLAANDDTSCGVDLQDWYRQKYGREPEYSELIDAVARTPAERQNLLRPYFEPDEIEREQGLKQPTVAHRAIAQLVADGFIKVIVTTNFDQLIETALRDIGIVPTVLSTPDLVAGSLPLVHTRCCVFKVHGDYMDPRILNSHSELGVYSPELDRLLDEIFDQFGLIVCGWSAEWDIALRNALTRSVSRRFTTYWACRGVQGEAAQRLIQHRDAQTVPIDNADAFFLEVQETVASIAQFSRMHPLSTQAAVETLKRYLPNVEHRIRRADHIDNVVRRLVSSLSEEQFPLDGPISQDSFAARVGAYESACSTLLAMAVVAGYWAEDDHFQDWERAVRQLCYTSEIAGDSVCINLRHYPVLLLLYALGFGLVKTDRLRFLGRLFDITVENRMWGHPESPVMDAAYMNVTHPNWNLLLLGQQHALTPLHDRLHGLLNEPCRQLLLTDKEYSFTFDKLEILMALSVGRRMNAAGWGFPIGSFLHRGRNRLQILKEVNDSLNELGDSSPFVLCGVIGSDAKECLEAVDDFGSYVLTVAQHHGVRNSPIR